MNSIGKFFSKKKKGSFIIRKGAQTKGSITMEVITAEGGVVDKIVCLPIQKNDKKWWGAHIANHNNTEFKSLLHIIQFGKQQPLFPGMPLLVYERLYTVDVIDMKFNPKVEPTLIGSGEFGKIYRLKTLDDNHDVCAKILTDSSNADSLDNFLDEVKGLRLLDSPYILKLDGIMMKNPSETFQGIDLLKEKKNDRHLSPLKIKDVRIPMMITEYCKGGSLNKYGDALNYFSTDEIVCIFYSAALGIKLMHSLELVHRDIAARNIFLDLKDQRYYAKIGDFGMCRKLSSGIFLSRNSRLPINMTAPEAFVGKKKIM